MVFDEYFDRVVIINLPKRKDRLSALLSELKAKGLSSSPTVVRAVHGETVGISSWFHQGAGAWGCLLSHARVIQDFLMDFFYDNPEDYNDFKTRKLLVLEDDAIFSEDAAERFARFVSLVPKDWGQIYLGGQHRKPATKINDEVLLAGSINRTHAYGVQGRAAQRFHRHIMYSPDYISTGNHIDHQLETAHQREDWKTYCPHKWIAGQRAGVSDIFMELPHNIWWDYKWDDTGVSIPYYFTDKEPKELPEGFISKEIMETAPADVKNELSCFLRHSWDRRLHPMELNTFNQFFIFGTPENGSESIVEFLRKKKVLINDDCNQTLCRIREIVSALPLNTIKGTETEFFQSILFSKVGKFKWGVYDTQIGKNEGWGLRMFIFLKYHFPDAAFIFCQDTLEKTLPRVLGKRSVWIPNYGTCNVDCERRIVRQHMQFSTFGQFAESQSFFVAPNTDLEKLWKSV